VASAQAPEGREEEGGDGEEEEKREEEPEAPEEEWVAVRHGSDRGPGRRKPLGHPQLIRADAHDRGDHERHEDADASHVLSPFRRCRRVEASLEVMNWV